MKLHEWINLIELEQLIEEGIVSDRKHLTLPLKILNYTHAASSVKEWSLTLRRCRGLVYEITTGDIYAIPFEKFFSWDDPKSGALPNRVPIVYEKLDGSYLQLFEYKDTWICSTRGSFESEQAKWARKYIDANFDFTKQSPYCKNYNYVFEVIIGDDRKVVKYEYEGLVLLGSISRNSGLNLNPFDTKETTSWLSEVRIPRKFTFTSFPELSSRDLNNEEGYVICWEQDGYKRAKVKMATYQRLHRLYFQTTTDVIWELLKAGGDKADPIRVHLEGADADLINWAVGVSLGIIERRLFIANQSKEDFRDAMQYCNLQHDLEASEKDRRKAFAFKASQSKNPGLLFLLYDGKFKEYDEQLWKIVRPVPSERYTKVEE